MTSSFLVSSDLESAWSENDCLVVTNFSDCTETWHLHKFSGNQTLQLVPMTTGLFSPTVSYLYSASYRLILEYSFARTGAWMECFIFTSFYSKLIQSWHFSVCILKIYNKASPLPGLTKCSYLNLEVCMCVLFRHYPNYEWMLRFCHISYCLLLILARSLKSSGIGRLLVTVIEAQELKACKPNGEAPWQHDSANACFVIKSR